jgi:type IV secretory pathway ATPase VirB11/archaellum biosynthesis ATPase
VPLRDHLPSVGPLATDASADGPPTGDCRCTTAFAAPADRERTTLVLRADDCPGRGDLATPDCRARAVAALAERDADRVRVRRDGLDHWYEGAGATLLLAAGRFVELAGVHDSALARRAHRHPLDAAREAVGRAGPVARVATETGLAACLSEGPAEPFSPRVAPTVAGSHVRPTPPDDGELADTTALPTGGTARTYATARATPTYHLSPVWLDFDPAATRALAAAYETLAEGGVGGGDRAAGRAVRSVVDDPPDADLPLDRVTAVLRRHTRGLGVLEPLLSDPRVADVYATAPVTETPLRAVVDGRPMRTNVRLTADGAAALASRFRRTSGRAFSRASPTLDATAQPTTGESERVRVAGVTDPASDGPAFAFRAGDPEAWTLPRLVATGSVSAAAAALLSVAVERAAAGLVAGTRGAGKTTTLGALLWELPAATRAVLVEDTPELPVDALQRADRDVQALRTATDDGPSVTPTEALRTALRLGEGALVVGEVRGEEAAVLYEAMRVGASGSAVLGTIHGDGGPAVRERVVADLGVPPSSFAATDLLVTCAVDGSAADAGRHVASVEEVVETDDGVGFAPLFERDADGLATTGRVDRGNSRLVAGLTRPDETYADLLALLDARESLLATLAAGGRTRPADVVAAYRDRRRA